MDTELECGMKGKALGVFFERYGSMLVYSVMTALVFSLLMFLASVQKEVILYAWLMSFAFLFLGSLVKYWKTYQELALFEQEDYQLETFLEVKYRIKDSLYAELLQSWHASYQKKASESRQRQNDQLEYFTLWLHQIKTPIASMDMLLQVADLEKQMQQTMKAAMRDISRYTNMALQYLKLENPAADMHLSKIDLDAVIENVLKKYSSSFIYGKRKLSYQPTEMVILSDAMWLEVCIEQILSNSIKYSPEGLICIYAAEDVPDTLVISDNGVGIQPEELPRVFTKGYSGINGQLSERSTGIGLYLCKTICDRLGHHITIRSEVGKGTRVNLYLGD